MADATVGRLSYQVNPGSVTAFAVINEAQPIARLWKRQYIGYPTHEVVCMAAVDAMVDAEYETQSTFYNQEQEK